AALAGILIGDRIQKIDGQVVSEISTDEMESLLGGNRNQYVSLDILRPSQNLVMHFDLQKRKIDIESISAACMLDTITGYIRITHFAESTPIELDLAFAELNGVGMRRLLLDLRNNSGGDFEAGIAVADRFIEGGKLIVFTQGRAPQTSGQFIATSSVTFPQLPLVVLVNEKTASDAEIITGAIQDWDRGIVVGRTTFGKALVQTEYPFQDGSIRLLTTARYYTPLGRSIQNENVLSDEGKSPAVAPKKFKTPKGRFVSDGGGIQPDFESKKNAKSIPALLKKFYAEDNDYFLKFADEYIVTIPEETRPKKQNDFLAAFQMDDVLWNRFSNWVSNQPALKINSGDLDSIRFIVAAELKIALAWRLWGDEGRNAATAAVDEEVQKSLQYFEQADKILLN
ncbi:MAG: hypothetical protein EHM72_20345, partial [Calditrichaeota bacterium]